MISSTSLRACLVLALGLPACGPTPGSTDTTDGASTGGSSGESSTGESSTSDSGAPTTGSAPSEWPRRVTLVTNLSGEGTPALRFADGALLTEGGDIQLGVAYVLALRASPDSVCEQGTFAALEDVPLDLDTCPEAGAWSHFAYLDASSLHTEAESTVIGLGLLVWDEAHTTMYRLRVLGDSYDQQGQATVTFDYEPAPASP